jgi:TPR repeat protein
MANHALANMKDMAASGDATAQYNLAIMHMTGNGANKDDAEAARLFTLASRQGYAPAQRQLAQMYLRGDAVGKSKIIAHSLLNLAAKGTGAEADAARQEMEKLEQAMSASEIAEAQKLAAVDAAKGR